MRRLMLLVAAGSLWLFLAAVPVFADGGPHIAAVNSGANGLSADSCAGCHRAHTAQGEFLLVADSATSLCLTCHGSTGLGSTVDVENGIQYTLAADGSRDTGVLGYTRGGGFVTARIGSSEAVRVAYLSGANVRQNAKVPVRTAGSQDVTSAHLPNAGGVVASAEGVAWGNGPDSIIAVRRTRGRPRVRHLPQPARQRPVPDPEPDPEPRCGGRRTRSSRPPSPPPSPTRRSRPPATPATTPSSRPTVARGPSSPARSTPSTCPPPPATTSVARFRGTAPPARPTTRRTAMSATFTTQISTWCTHVPLAVPQPGLGGRRGRRDLQVPPHRHQHVAELHHVPRVARFQRADDGLQLVHDGVPGRGRCPGRRQPPPEGRQPRNVPAVPRSDGDDRRRNAGRPDAGPGSPLAMSAWWPATPVPATTTPPPTR